MGSACDTYGRGEIQDFDGDNGTKKTMWKT
jgi:hypothetical protein